MTAEFQWILMAAIAWLAGSIPFSLLIGYLAAGIDLRQHGSGNVGATNVARTLGVKWGALALLLDALKGALPVLMLPNLMQIPGEWLVNARVVCGAGAILGHMFPPWLGFRGGKGVATALGVVAVLAPASLGWAFLSFVATFVLTRIVSLSSIIAAIVFAIVQFAAHGRDFWTPHTWGLGVFSVLVPLLILVRHRANIVRLCRGEEKALQFRKKEPQKSASASAPVNAADETETEPNGA